MRGTLVSAFAVLLSVTALQWQAGTEPVRPAAAAASAKPAKGFALDIPLALAGWQYLFGALRAPTPAPAVPLFEVPPSGGIAPEVLRYALNAVQCATRLGEIRAPRTLTVIDYSRPSIEPRLWVFELPSGTLLFRELVAHGRNTGDNLATRFSDAMNSRQSSLGLFVTADTYVGSNGYSLRLNGLEPGFNGRARARAIVMHGAPYVNASLAAAQGRIGRSWGCPALGEGVAREVIDTIRGGGVIFSYYPDSSWLKSSRFLNGCAQPTAGAFATH